MTRDKEEWRRPWVAGDAPLPTGSRTGTAAWPAPDGPLRAADGRSLDDRAAEPSTAGYGRATTATASLTGGATVGAPGAAPAGPTSTRAPRTGGRRGGFLTGLVGGVLGALLTVVVLAPLGVLDGLLDDGTSETTDDVALDGATSTPAPAPAPAPEPLPGDGTASGIPDVADRVLPSVVRINTSGSANLTAGGALGSGVIYRSDGYIITNHHVIEGAAAVEVLLSSGDRYEAEIVGSDELNDLAVLRIERDGLPAIALRPNDDPLRVGETVVAIGSPFGLDATVTAGIISALNRDLSVPNSADVIPAVIQTDAAINPGNSGGALVDLRGRLVGINTAIVSRSGANEGVGFAVPVQQAVVSGGQLIEQGFVRYPLLGITGTDITAEIAEAFGLDNRRGAVVDSVQPGSGADASGLRPGDVIVAVDGIPLRSMADLVAEVRRRTPGDTVVFDVLREGQTLELSAVLGERPRS